MGIQLVLSEVGRMADSGVTSFNSSGSADISLDALDISSTNPSDSSAAGGNGSLEVPSPAAMPITTSAEENSMQIVAKPENISLDQSCSDLQR